ncbi:trypsin beta-like [Hermetia illucens]|uniref:trypsin beta-like n=1 Tax=Hermetia illucens TaxID=343691 RepID=UPI0018CC5DBF|nr:trypsin beta-like [Hermetia illucens]
MYRIVAFLLGLLASQGYGFKIQPRIVGGRTAAITTYPYQVSIIADGNHICGGAIIKPSTIITAGHCVYGRSATELSIRAGSDYRTSGGVVVQASGYKTHPNFNRNTLTFDEALIYLKTPLTYSSKIRPIQLINRGLRAKDTAKVSGWGTTSEGGQLSEVLRTTSFPIVSRARCKRIYKKALTRSMFCAGRMVGGRDTCQGDSGGPLTVDGKLAGVTSYGNGCGKRGYPGIYTRIIATRKWIIRNAK